MYIILRLISFFFSNKLTKQIAVYLTHTIYISSVSVYVTELLLNDLTDFDGIVCACLNGSLDSLYSQLDL